MLILVRHGQSTANVSGRLVGRTDAPLTDTGREQARALVPALARVVELRSSPLSRARETATLAVPHLHAELEDAFIEQNYGDLDGLEMSEVPPQLWREFRSSHHVALGGGESLADVDARVHGRLNELLGDEESLLHDAERHVVIVSHVSPIKSAVAWALGVDGSVAWRLRLDNATLTTIAVRSGEPYLVAYNDRSARGQGPGLDR